MDATWSGDAESTLAALTRDLEDAFVACAWTQWKLLGGTAAARKPAGPVAPIDPEALLLASLTLRDLEPRLADVMRDWLRANAGLISVQRLRNLAPHYASLEADDGRARLGWLAQVALTEAKDARWRGLASRSPAVAAGAMGRARAKSPPPAMRPTESHQLLLRLRLGLGVGIKADVVAFLLGRSADWHTIRDIARALTYTPAPLRRALEDLANAAFIDRRLGHPVRYAVDPARWQGLLALDGASRAWGSWDERFRFAAGWMTWARAPRRSPLTAYVFSVQARALRAEHREVFGAAESVIERAGAETALVLTEIVREVGVFSASLRTVSGERQRAG